MKISNKIYKGNFEVPMVIRQYFSFNTRSYGIHQAEVILTNDGHFILGIDGSHAFSRHDAAAKRSPLYKDAIYKLSHEMQGYMERCENAYTYLYEKTPHPKHRSVVERNLNNVVLKKYERKKFALPMPLRADVEADLHEEAKYKYFSLWSKHSSKIKMFVLDSIEEEYNERLSNWEILKQYHDSIQENIANKNDALYLEEYNKSRKSVEDELYGEDKYVKQQFVEMCTKLNSQIPLDVTIEIDYNKNDGIIDAKVSLPSYIAVPDKKVMPFTSDKISIKDKLKSELNNDTTNTILGFSYFISGYLFNLSVNVQKVRLSVVSGNSAYYWVEYERESFSKLSFSNLNPLQDFFCHPNVIDYKKSSIELIPESDFIERIKESIKISDLLSKNDDLVLLSVRDAERIYKNYEGADDLKQAVKEAKSNGSSVVVANKRYKNVLSEIDNY